MLLCSCVLCNINKMHFHFLKSEEGFASYQKKATVLSFKRVKNSKKDTEAMDFNRGFCTCAIHSLAQGYAAHRCRMASHEGPT